MIRTLAILCVLLASAEASAQFLPGDWIVSNRAPPFQGVYRLTPATGLWQSLTTGGAHHSAGLTMAADNSTVLSMNVADYSIDAFDQNAALVTGPLTTTIPLQLVVDQDGSYLTAQDYGLFRVDPVSGVETMVWFATNQFLHGVCVDGATGDYVTAGSGPFFDGVVTRIDPTSFAMTTLATGLGDVRCIDYNPATNVFLVANGATTSPVLSVSPAGFVSSFSTQAPAGAKAVRVDPNTGNVLIVGLFAAAMFTPFGALLASFPTPAVFEDATGAEIYGRRTASTSGLAAGGADFKLSVRDPSSANLPYLAAISEDLSTGPAVANNPSGCVCLETGVLFWSTLGGVPGLLLGFSGALDALGSADAHILLPLGFSPGYRFYAQAIVSVPSSPTGFRTTNVTGFNTL